MSLTYSQATDAMFSEFLNQWGDACPIIWQGQNISPPSNEIWCEVYRQNVTETQATLADDLGNGSGRRYETNGILYIAFKSPVTVENNFSKLSSLAETAKSIFRGRRIACDIVFKNCRILEQNSTNNNNLLIVACNYNYWEIPENIFYLPSDVWVNNGVYMAGEKPLPRGLYSNGGVIMTTDAFEYYNAVSNGGVLCVPNFKHSLPRGLEINGDVYMIGSASLVAGLSENGGVVMNDTRYIFENSENNGGVLMKV